MTNLPKDLFDMGRPDSKREYFFMDIYGKKSSVELGFGDQLLSYLRCPLDGAHIVSYSGDPHNVSECTACNEAFEGNDESVAKYVDNHYSRHLKERIRGMKTKLNQLEHILALLENPENPIKKANKNNEAYNEDYNKDNLSAKVNKSFGIVVDKSRATRTFNMRVTPFSKGPRLNH